MTITKDMLVTEIIEKDPDTAEILMQLGMHCIGCMAASGESLEAAMYVHGYAPEDVDNAVTMINEYLARKYAEPAQA